MIKNPNIKALANVFQLQIALFLNSPLAQLSCHLGVSKLNNIQQTTVLKCSHSFGLPVSSCIGSFHTSACVLISLSHPSHLSATNYRVRITHKGYISTQTQTHTYTCQLAVCWLVKKKKNVFPASSFSSLPFSFLWISLMELPTLKQLWPSSFLQQVENYSVHPDNSGPYSLSFPLLQSFIWHLITPDWT